MAVGHGRGTPQVGRAMRLAVLVIACAAALSVFSAADAAASRNPLHSAIRLQTSVGYGNIYRGSAWTPVHVRVRNASSVDVTGTIEIPQAQSSATGAQPDFHGLYEATVTVPAGATKDVGLYVPGSGIQGRVSVRFLTGTRVLATSTAAPIGLDTSSLLIGVVSNGPEEMRWIAPAIQQQVTTRVVQLSPASLDPVPQALASFDVIVLTNVDTSQLDSAQRGALQQYVEHGGSLLLVGGPTWQETLRPLPGTLLPGSVTGTRALTNLHGLLPLALGSVAHLTQAPAVVSVLAHPTGTVLASQAGVPLVVRKSEGQGAVEYLAFDPALTPVSGWPVASGLTQHLVAMAAPLAISRTWSPTAFRARFQQLFQTNALTNELSNLPSITLPFLLFFALLTLGYILILGPINFVLLRRMRRQSLAWITIPVLGLAYLGSIFAVVPHVRAASAVLNTVGVVTLGTPGGQGATIYMGLATPMSGDYHLSYSIASLPAPLPQLDRNGRFSFRDASTLHDTPLGMRIQEDPQTAVSFLSMQRWTIRSLSVDTSVHIPGGVQSRLTLDTQGNLSGIIRNSTNLDLLDPVVIAGQTVIHLPDLRSGGSAFARLRPSWDTYGSNGSSFLAEAYGGSALSSSGDFGWFGDCCGGATYTPEHQLIDRIRNAAGMLSQAQPGALSSLGAVILVGWTDRPLGAVSVDGSTPTRRDISLVAVPLSVALPSHGKFQLPEGTINSQLVDILPRAPQSNCCGFGWGRDEEQATTVGSGGFLTFEFDLPMAHRVAFRTLALRVGNGDTGANRGRVYDWRSGRWVPIDLTSGTAQLQHPGRFISAGGQLMVRLESGGDLSVSDPSHDVQLTGAGAVS